MPHNELLIQVHTRTSILDKLYQVIYFCHRLYQQVSYTRHETTMILHLRYMSESFKHMLANFRYFHYQLGVYIIDSDLAGFMPLQQMIHF